MYAAEIKSDYIERLATLSPQGDTTLEWQKNLASLKMPLITFQWNNFISLLNHSVATNPAISNIFVRANQPITAPIFITTMYFSIDGFLGLPSQMKRITWTGECDLVTESATATYIFEIKLKEYRKNPLVHCLNTCVHAFFYRGKKAVCIALKFSQKGEIAKWGVLEYSEEGKLLNEQGPIKLPKGRKAN